MEKRRKQDGIRTTGGWMTWDRRKSVSICPKGKVVPLGFLNQLHSNGWCVLSIVWHWRSISAGGGAGGTDRCNPHSTCIR